MKLSEWLDQPPEAISDSEISHFIEVIRNTKKQPERAIKDEDFGNGSV